MTITATSFMGAVLTIAIASNMRGLLARPRYFFCNKTSAYFRRYRHAHRNMDQRRGRQACARLERAKKRCSYPALTSANRTAGINPMLQAALKTGASLSASGCYVRRSCAVPGMKLPSLPGRHNNYLIQRPILCLGPFFGSLSH